MAAPSLALRCAAALSLCPMLAAAQSAGFAEPPHVQPWPDDDDSPRPAIATDEPTRPSIFASWDRERSPVRFTVGPQTTFTNHGAHFGALAGLDFGKSRIGGRLSASWARGLDTPGSGASVSQFGGELTLDLAKRGLLHPVFGLGLALLYIEHASREGGAVDVKAFAGAGTLRAGLEIPIPIREADLRVGVFGQGGLVGPSDERLSRMRGLGNVMATIALGF